MLTKKDVQEIAKIIDNKLAERFGKFTKQQSERFNSLTKQVDDKFSSFSDQVIDLFNSTNERTDIVEENLSGEIKKTEQNLVKKISNLAYDVEETLDYLKDHHLRIKDQEKRVEKLEEKVYTTAPSA
ncbi:hypothetical protein HY612_03530 [Candidatus Roizmanbacteria bacterium]|nr:hypothetical protein [Candidatus Roizmanbacteria bacterium]